LVKVTASINL